MGKRPFRRQVSSDQSEDEDRAASASWLKPGSAVSLMVVLCMFGAAFRSTEMTRQMSLRMKFDQAVLMAEIQNQAEEEEEQSRRRREPQFVYNGYKPAPVEAWVMNHTEQLGLTKKIPEYSKTCHVLTDPKATPYHDQLNWFVQMK